ncbi:MCE family protein [Nocardioides marmoriginsengisoli]|uniref:MCE family protein n=1 Tax=Nocardioides marmoriginsengisoli TaxID=661483 RepID=A0A3N0CHN9_9ACTN|nr:MCE family protein [Nocardioides marmoriginsengisoli]RNL62789.1 MCE family protein [Nocardioides marmoriginsengisoli]
MRFKTSTLAKVLVFVVVTGFLVTLVGLTFSQVRVEKKDTYRAIFSNASGLASNVDVRGSGVSIGSVKSISRRDAGGVVVTFTVKKGLRLPETSEARIRYANLTGDRYLELTPGDGPRDRVLRVGATIPETRTKPALELDDLFAGFDPLMQALSPEEVNELSTNILAVTQGEAGAVKSMLANVGSFTSGLAERDELIGSVITELSKTLTTLDGRKDEFDDLLVALSDLTGKVRDDREAFGKALSQFSALGTDIGDFIEAIRPGLKANIAQLAIAAGKLNDDEPYLRQVLGVAKQALMRGGRLGGNASQFNFFLCSLRVKVEVPGTAGFLTPNLFASDDRCKKGAN